MPAVVAGALRMLRHEPVLATLALAPLLRPGVVPQVTPGGGPMYLSSCHTSSPVTPYLQTDMDPIPSAWAWSTKRTQASWFVDAPWPTGRTCGLRMYYTGHVNPYAARKGSAEGSSPLPGVWGCPPITDLIWVGGWEEERPCYPTRCAPRKCGSAKMRAYQDSFFATRNMVPPFPSKDSSSARGCAKRTRPK